MLGLKIYPFLFELVQHGCFFLERRELTVLPFNSFHDHAKGLFTSVKLFFSRFLLLQLGMVLGNLLPLFVDDFLLVAFAHNWWHIKLTLKRANVVFTLLASFSHLHHVPVHVHEISFVGLLYSGKIVCQFSGCVQSDLIV